MSCFYPFSRGHYVYVDRHTAVSPNQLKDFGVTEDMWISMLVRIRKIDHPAVAIQIFDKNIDNSCCSKGWMEWMQYPACWICCPALVVAECCNRTQCGFIFAKACVAEYRKRITLFLG